MRKREFGHNNHDRAGARLDFDRFGDLVVDARHGLLDDAGLFDERDVLLSGAVADWRFAGVHFDQAIVHAHAGERAEDVLDGVNFRAALGDCRGALDGLHVVDLRVDDRLVSEIGALKFPPVAGSIFR